MRPDLAPEPRPLHARACLVLGGARSGKSDMAQRFAERSGLAPVYLATATVWDDEMRERVAAHRGGRDERWTTIEEPLALSDVLVREAGADRIVLIDCLTLWLTNLMLGGHDIAMATRDLVTTIHAIAGPVLFVSNEVGAGVVPDNALGRRFRDAQGRLNQLVAAACDTVVLVTAGLPLLIKPAPAFDLRF